MACFSVKINTVLVFYAWGNKPWPVHFLDLVWMSLVMWLGWPGNRHLSLLLISACFTMSSRGTVFFKTLLPICLTPIRLQAQNVIQFQLTPISSSHTVILVDIFPTGSLGELVLLTLLLKLFSFVFLCYIQTYRSNLAQKTDQKRIFLHLQTCGVIRQRRSFVLYEASVLRQKCEDKQKEQTALTLVVSSTAVLCLPNMWDARKAYVWTTDWMRDLTIRKTNLSQL